MIGQWIADALNCSVYTYEVAPVFTIMEEYVFSELRYLIGFAEGDGIFSPGGSIANGYAINCARFHKFPEIKVYLQFILITVEFNLNEIVMLILFHRRKD